MDCSTLVFIAAKEIQTRLQEFLPEFEVMYGHQAESRPDGMNPISGTPRWINVGYPEITVVDPNDAYHPYNGGVGGPPEVKNVQAVRLKCETWSGLIKVVPFSEYVKVGDQLVMHIENPKVFDWAIDRFMEYLEFWIMKRISPAQADIIARRRGKIQARRY